MLFRSLAHTPHTHTRKIEERLNKLRVNNRWLVINHQIFCLWILLVPYYYLLLKLLFEWYTYGVYMLLTMSPHNLILLKKCLTDERKIHLANRGKLSCFSMSMCLQIFHSLLFISFLVQLTHMLHFYSYHTCNQKEKWFI